MAFTRPQAIELFHLALLTVLSRTIDQRRYVLKGGANLRYFFASPRYSEDIDLDLTTIPAWRLEEKIDELLESQQLKLILRQSEIEVVESSKPKQTETTQRWKVGIAVPGQQRLVRTKIEFSKRNGDDRHRLEAIPAAVLAPYALRPPFVQHYIDGAPTEQKIRALAGRAQTQARDVFDLDLLLRRKAVQRGAIESKILEEAACRALELTFDDFEQQVVEYLEPAATDLYGTPQVWEQMQTAVAEALEAALI